MKNLFYILAATFILAACTSATAEEKAAEAAKDYYDRLVEGYPEGFLEGKAGIGHQPGDYCEQLLATYKKYLEDVKKKHGGIREVMVSPHVGRSDTTLQVTYAFLLLCYEDSTQEEIIVPMVQVANEWRMK